jgi:hypothetical protein
MRDPISTFEDRPFDALSNGLGQYAVLFRPVKRSRRRPTAGPDAEPFFPHRLFV